MTPEERAAAAAKRKHDAWVAIQKQLLPFGDGRPSQESIEELERAENEWWETQAVAKTG